MGYSSLVNYIKLSPNCTKPRNHVIDTISVHCMAGKLSIETCLGMARFQVYDAKNGASCNYAIDGTGRIGLGVDEDNRSWCTSSRSNDHRAITIEVANTAGAPDWPVSDKAFAALIDLCTDICKRHNIKQLLWKGDKGLIGQVDLQNMTVHRWFANKACPGNYLYNKHGELAAEVNKRLKGEKDLTRQETIELFNELYQKKNPLYPDVSDVPSFWRPALQVLLDRDILNGGTPRSVNDTDVNLSQDTIKALVLMKAYIDQVLEEGGVTHG